MVNYTHQEMDAIITADFNKHAVNGQVRTEKYIQMLQTLNIEQSQIQKFQIHYRDKGQFNLSIGDIRTSLAIPLGGFNIQQPPKLIPMNPPFNNFGFTDQFVNQSRDQKKLNALAQDQFELNALAQDQFVNQKRGQQKLNALAQEKMLLQEQKEEYLDKAGLTTKRTLIVEEMQLHLTCCDRGICKAISQYGKTQNIHSENFKVKLYSSALDFSYINEVTTCPRGRELNVKMDALFVKWQFYQTYLINLNPIPNPRPRRTIGPPPSFDPSQYQINGIRDFDYSQHSLRLQVVMREIHEFEEQIKQQVRITFQNGYQGGFSLNAKWGNLDQMVAYITSLKIEIQNLQVCDSRNVRQINKLIQYIIQYQQWYQWKIVQKNYWQEWKDAEARCLQLKLRVDQLELENGQLRSEIIILKNQINDLQLQIAQLRERLRIIGFLQRIISTQAYEITGHKGTIDGHMIDLNGMEEHYRNHYGNIRGQMLQITQSINAQSYARQGGFMTRDLRQAMTCVINNGAKKDKNTGQDVYDDRNEVKEVIQILMTMDQSFQGQSFGLGLDNNFATPPGFEENWQKYTMGSNGILRGNQAIMGFFEHVIAHREKMI